MQEFTKVMKASGVGAPKANSAVTVDSEHNSALDGLSQRKNGKILKH